VRRNAGAREDRTALAQRPLGRASSLCGILVRCGGTGMLGAMSAWACLAGATLVARLGVDELWAADVAGSEGSVLGPSTSSGFASRALHERCDMSAGLIGVFCELVGRGAVILQCLADRKLDLLGRGA
jgi:hypothetical protein